MERGKDSPTFRRVFSQLRRAGLLLESDSKLPCVTRLVAGSPIRGSWWGHPKGREIFWVMVKLAAHPDVMKTRLISGKVTFVHRNLWGELLSVATSGEPWQFAGISSAARSLLTAVNREGMLRTDRLPKPEGRDTGTVGAAAHELEKKLLVSGEQFHTERGSHAKKLESWEHWATRMRPALKSIAVREAREVFEQRLKRLNEQSGASARLPWQSHR